MWSVAIEDYLVNQSYIRARFHLASIHHGWARESWDMAMVSTTHPRANAARRELPRQSMNSMTPTIVTDNDVHSITIVHPLHLPHRLVVVRQVWNLMRSQKLSCSNDSSSDAMWLGIPNVVVLLLLLHCAHHHVVNVAVAHAPHSLHCCHDDSASEKESR